MEAEYRMEIKTAEITELLKQQIEKFQITIAVDEAGDSRVQ